MDTIILNSTITCPECGARTAAEMPSDACQFFWPCPACGTVLRPKRATDGAEGDCCVFCSYGDVSCPPIQRAAGKGVYGGASCCG